MVNNNSNSNTSKYNTSSHHSNNRNNSIHTNNSRCPGKHLKTHKNLPASGGPLQSY